MANLKNITIHTDGSCLGNPGPGGYGVLLLYGDGREEKELSGGRNKTTNNRMEIKAAIKGLESLGEKPCEVTLYSDSRYLVDAMSKGWAERWRRNGWMRNKREQALNVDLWEQLLELVQQHEVRFEWVKGHDGNRYNERVDRLATTAARQPNLPPDHGYLNS